jgi:hypothetical protein
MIEFDTEIPLEQQWDGERQPNKWLRATKCPKILPLAYGSAVLHFLWSQRRYLPVEAHGGCITSGL